MPAKALGKPVGVIRRGDNVVLEVVDGGCGLPARCANGGVGLHSMAERVLELGGRLTVLPRPGGGTVVRGEILAAG